MTAPRDNDRAAWLLGPVATANCPKKSSELPADRANPWRLVLLGAPGVGKGTQAGLLSEHLGACHLSTGDVFRAAIKGRGDDQSPAMEAALEHMRRGDLVPDSTVWEMVRERSNCLLHCGFILDGFPRTVGQAECLKTLMEQEQIPLGAVVNYELPEEEIILRLSGRRTCDKCKAIFHLKQKPPKVAATCDHCGGTLYQRPDDRPEAITVRLEAYDRCTAPLINFYRNLGLLVSIAATGSPAEIFSLTLAALEAREPSGQK
jgi:adenylate kinase